MRLTTALPLAGLVALAAAHGDHASGGSPEVTEAWQAKYGQAADLTFSGVTTFAHLPHFQCLNTPSELFDVAILGLPFDTAVSYRPGARFGPNAIRQGSRRHAANRAFSIPWNFNALKIGARVVDCGDVPVTPYDNAVAMEQIEAAYDTLLGRGVATEWAKEQGRTSGLAGDGRERPRIVGLGGDHSVVYPILKSLNKVYGEIAVIHFDAHLDTWNGRLHLGSWSPTSEITHGSFFWQAAREGLISNTSSIHAGIRTRLSDFSDLTDDADSGFMLLTTDDIDDLGADGIAEAIIKRVGDAPCYLSFDIDTVDPSMAPATGTPESGGWTTREVKRILRGLAGLNLVGLDVVEVSPAYDSNAELTAMAAADLVQEFLALLHKPVGRKGERVAPAVKGGKLNPPQDGGRATGVRDEL